MEELNNVKWKLQREFQTNRLEVEYRADAYERIVPLDGAARQAADPGGVVVDVPSLPLLAPQGA